MELSELVSTEVPLTIVFSVFGAIITMLLLMMLLSAKSIGDAQGTAIALLIVIIITALLLSVGVGDNLGAAQTNIPQGTFLVENASSSPDGNLHVVVRGKYGEKSITRYVVLKNTEVKNFPAEPVLAGTIKLVVKDVEGSGQKWRTYTFTETK